MHISKERSHCILGRSMGHLQYILPKMQWLLCCFYIDLFYFFFISNVLFFRYLHEKDPNEWTVDRLTESFPLTRDGIIGVLKRNGPKSLEKVLRQDKQVTAFVELFIFILQIIFHYHINCNYFPII